VDLKLRFSSQAVHDALGHLQPGYTYEVWITGKVRGWNTGSGQRLHPRGASLVAESAPATVKPVHSERY